MSAAFDFWEALERARSEAEAFALLEGAVRKLGYAIVDYWSGTLSTWPIANAMEWRIDTARSTLKWEADYAGTDFQRHDRVVPFASRQNIPWLYWDLWARPPTHPAQQKMESNVQALVGSGLGVPFHDDCGRFTGLHCGSELSREELARLDRETRPDMFLIAAIYHAWARPGLKEPTADDLLTPRERDLLSWAARGKTAWESSVILGVSESAVKKQLAAAAAKLGARTRTHAVAQALTRGLIEP